MILVAAAFLLAIAPQARAETLSGEWFTDFRAPVASFPVKRLQQASTSLWLKGDAEVSEAAKARIEVAADAFASKPVGEARTRLLLREGYLTYAQGGWELRAGSQILVWGNADVRSPTDYLSARDFTDFNPEDERRRLGAASLQLGWTPSEGSSPWSVKAVWTPDFPRSRVLTPPGVLPAGVTDSGPVEPRWGIGSSEYALKGSYLGSGWDVALSAFSGWNHTPFYSIASISPSGILLEQRYRRMQALGIESSITRDEWVFRFEGAYKATDPGYWDLVAGAERPLGERFRLQTQLFVRAYRHLPVADPINAALFDYQEAVPVNASIRLSYTSPSGDFESELFVMAGLKKGGYLLRPKVAYRFLENTKFQAGIDGYGGPQDRLLGAALPYRAVFMEFQRIF